MQDQDPEEDEADHNPKYWQEMIDNTDWTKLTNADALVTPMKKGLNKDDAKLA
jgi:hypothetical protein